VSDVELTRGLASLAPTLAPSDAAFLIKYMKDRFRAASDKLTPEGFEEDNTTGGLAAGTSVGSIAEWVTKQPGGHESKYSKDADAAAAAAEGGDGAPPTPVAAGDRLNWGSRAQKFVAFRAGWEAKHGHAAAKELAHDAALPVDGPTWARADPQPFKVVHFATPAPPPSPRV